MYSPIDIAICMAVYTLSEDLANTETEPAMYLVL